MESNLIKHYHSYLGEDKDIIFARILPELLKTTKTYQFKMYDKLITTSRRSCIYTDQKEKVKRIGYEKTPKYSWDQAPKDIIDIKNQLIKEHNAVINYVLVHIYRNDTDYIGWHNDSEAMNSDIFSVSLGITRRFLMRPYNDKKSYTKEYILKSGDLIKMSRGCQQKYKHTIPKMKCSELKKLVTDLGYTIKGRVTFIKLRALIEKNNIDIKRINMTFRCLEEINE